MKRKIAVITGTRAEYTLLYWLMKEISADSDLELQLIVTGSHLSSQFGNTVTTIERDGFKITEKLNILSDADQESDSSLRMTKSLSLAVEKFGEAFARLKPDLVVVLGDRYEVLAAAQAALLARIPLGHIHGGEITQGAVDDSMRHAITKMARLHFVAAEEYKARVIQMGEQPESVFNFGAPGLEYMSRTKLLDKSEFEKQTKFKLGDCNFLVTFHPETAHEDPGKGIEGLLAALTEFPQAKIIFTMPNVDAGGHIIAERIQKFVSENPSRTFFVPSLGPVLYLSAVKLSDAVIGNSSSGILEAPALKRATVNVGDRQSGRLKATSVIDCEGNSGAIVRAIKKALSEEFQRTLQKTASLYGEGKTSEKIKEIIKSVPLKKLGVKEFYDFRS